ncbi:MAG TPA: hypothetical protein VJP58_00150 [Candidatus Nitrosocosmicus sp.]|nr:hypothetical protein [Candidatus Nitrosocosmicus sp.]
MNRPLFMGMVFWVICNVVVEYLLHKLVFEIAVNLGKMSIFKNGGKDATFSL